MRPKTRLAVWQRDGGRCRCCGANEDLTVDHIVPLDAGGSEMLANLQTLCRGCNARKGRGASCLCQTAPTQRPVLPATELRAWMKEHGWSVRRLAAEIGVDYRTVQRWRDGTSPVPRLVELALKTLEK